jgi:ribonuclease HII
LNANILPKEPTPRRRRNKPEVDTFFYERKAKEEGRSAVAGIDEAGRGPLAGPVVAGAVIVRDPVFTGRIDDSKLLTERMREKAFIEIVKKCDVGIGMASVDEIDTFNIFNATLLAMKRAIEELSLKPDMLLIDGNMDIRLPQPRLYLVRGESKSLSIACASIAAKVFRDRLMMELDREYPVYGFSKHKGYGTKDHVEAIKRHGLSPIHRRSFGPFGDKRKGVGNEL